METVQPIKKAPKYISWDWLEGAFVCSRGNCYKTIEDIPPQWRHLVRDKHTVQVPEQVYKKYQT